jgi:hypothetical protein
MENLILEGSHGEFDTPSVNFDASTGICELAGESYLENTVEFYNHLLKWLDSYFNEVKQPLTFNFKLTYFNTSSSKRILYILLKLKEYKDKGAKVTVNWYYNREDIEMEEDVEDLGMIARLKINMVHDDNIYFDE